MKRSTSSQRKARHCVRSSTSRCQRQEIQYNAKAAATLQQPNPPPGIKPYTAATRGTTFQQMAAQAGSSGQPGALGIGKVWRWLTASRTRACWPQAH